MLNNYVINLIGLGFDITGVLILFKYGLPSKVSEGGVIGIILEKANTEEAKKYDKYKMYSNIGLTFILIGFVLQVISDIIPLVCSSSSTL